MHVQQWFQAIAVPAAFCCLCKPAAADPFRITGGYIQIGLSSSTDFIVRTSDHVIAGEREIGAANPVMFAGFPGTSFNLSTTFTDFLSCFGVNTFGCRAGRVDFRFESGNGGGSANH